MAQSFVASTSALQDLSISVRSWRLWLLMSGQDIKQRYRGSLLGPIWVAGGLVAMSLGAGTVYAAIFHQPIREYIPFIATGLAIWTLIQAAIAEGCTGFLSAAGLMKNTSLPIFIHILRVMARNLIVLTHNLVVVAAILLIFRAHLGVNSLLVLPGIFLVIINMTWMCYLSGMVCARYRDAIQIIPYFVTFLTFVTPIFWSASTVSPERQSVVRLNPFAYLVSVFRDPLLGKLPLHGSWMVLSCMAVLGIVVSILVHVKFRRNLVFWI